MQTDDHFCAAVPRIQRVSVSLAAVANHRNDFAIKQRQIRILIVVESCHELEFS